MVFEGGIYPGGVEEKWAKNQRKIPSVMDENGVRGRVVDMGDERGRKEVKRYRRGVSSGTYRI